MQKNTKIKVKNPCPTALSDPLPLISLEWLIYCFIKNRIYITLLNLISHDFNRRENGQIKPNKVLNLK